MTNSDQILSSPSASVWKKALVGILLFSVVAEFLLAASGFLIRGVLLAQFGLAITPDTSFLAYCLTWLVLAIGLVCGLSLKQVLNDNPNGWTLSQLLGLWWIGIGLALFFKYGKVENLILDAIKGAIIVLCAFKSKPKV